MKKYALIARRLTTETLKEWREDSASNVAAALAYYAIFSLSPLLIVLALVLGLVIGNNTAQDEVLGSVQETLGDQGASLMGNALDQSEPGGDILSVMVWFGVVFWGVSGLFMQLQKALNIIWEVRLTSKASRLVFAKNRLLSFSVVMVVCVLLVVSTLANTAVAEYEFNGMTGLLVRPVQFLLNLGLITFLFAAIFTILPDVDIHWSDVWVGALFTAVLFILGQLAVGFYISNSNIGSVYGAAGSLTVILVWIYYSAQILLLGAEFTEVWSRYQGSALQPDSDAEWVNPHKAQRELEATVKFMESLEAPIKPTEE